MAGEHVTQPSTQSQTTPSLLGSSNEGEVHPQIPTDPNHGKVLEDSSDEHEEVDNEGFGDADSIASDADADASSIVGISIGQNQDVMKSPSTPAITKAQALESSRSYFAAEDDGQNHYFQEPLDEPSSQDTPSVHAKTTEGASIHPFPKQIPSTSDEGGKHEKRSSLIGSILGATSNNSRQRASSGPLWMDSIRKILPSLPSITPSGFGSAEKSEQKTSDSKVLGPAGPGSVRSNALGPAGEKKASSSPSNEASNLVLADSDPTHNESTSNRDPSRPAALRRATSDQSLYLRKAPTGASQFDDYNNFADVSEMVNSRFKAITDSLQDSSLRMPKMLSISRGDRNSVADTRTSNDTTNNTKTNTGSSRAETLASVRRGESNITNVTNTSRHPIIKDALSQMFGDLIIMGGYRGSILREAQAPHRQLWVPVKVGLNLRKADLEVGLSRQDELRMEETIIADGTLSHIGPVDISRRLIKKCRKCANVKDGNLRVHDYGYDWRLSPDLLTDRYIRYLESLHCNQQHLPPSERGAWVIAHSLGGLITRNAINRRPDLFAGVLYAGTPQNCVNILGPLRNGDDVLFSSRVLTAQVNFTLRTSYALLPQNGQCFINKQTGERYDLDFFDVKTWEEYRLSPCIRAAFHKSKPEKRHSILTGAHENHSHSISSRYSSWFSMTPRNDTAADSINGKSVPHKLKDKAIDAKDDIADTAETAAEQNKPDGPLSPSLADAQSQRPSIATTVTIPLPAATEYLTRTLASVLAFKAALSHKPDIQAANAYPPAAVLFAKNTPTVYGAFVESREAIKYDDAFDELAFAAGDGVVLASAAQLPNGYRCVRNGRVESERGHVGLLGDIEGVGKCLLAIIEARRKGVGMGAHEGGRAGLTHEA